MNTRQDWRTLPIIYDLLNEKFGPFTLDAAASDEWHVCGEYFTEETDGLKSSWGAHNVFCNPPFSIAKDFVDKALAHLEAGHSTTILTLASYSSKAFHRAWEKSVVYIPNKRIEYWHPDETNQKLGNFTRDSVLFRFSPSHVRCGIALPLDIPNQRPQLKELHELLKNSQ